MLVKHFRFVWVPSKGDTIILKRKLIFLFIEFVASAGLLIFQEYYKRVKQLGYEISYKELCLYSLGVDHDNTLYYLFHMHYATS